YPDPTNGKLTMPAAPPPIATSTTSPSWTSDVHRNGHCVRPAGPGSDGVRRCKAGEKPSGHASHDDGRVPTRQAVAAGGRGECRRCRPGARPVLVADRHRCGNRGDPLLRRRGWLAPAREGPELRPRTGFPRGRAGGAAPAFPDDLIRFTQGGFARGQLDLGG